MTEDRVPTHTGPRTEAGRNTLRQPPGSLDEWRGAILAIEAEASAEGWNRANDAARAAAAEQPAPPLDVERLGFFDLLDVADAILRHYPPDTIVCSHLNRADIGARTVAAIADLVTSVRLGSALSRSEPEEVNDD